MTRRVEIAILLLIGIAPFYLNGWYNPKLAGHPTLFWLADIAAFGVLPLVIYCWGRHRKLFTTADLGLHTRVFGKPHPGLLALCIIIFAICAVPFDRWLIGQTGHVIPWPSSPPAFSYEQMLPPPGPSTGWHRLMSLTFMCVSAGVVEELYYRGIARIMFAGGWIQMTAYILCSSILFAAAHWEGGNAKLLYAFGWGLATVLLYLALGNLWPIIVAHVIVDWAWLST